jgi:hypothetical protein|tara:strand:+ start:150 stop:293 length:144 start_codon:yes stop_codon:yes gene_type:complete
MVNTTNIVHNEGPQNIHAHYRNQKPQAHKAQHINSSQEIEEQQRLPR